MLLEFYHVLRVSGKLNAKDNISEVENRIQTDDSGLIWYNGKLISTMKM